MITCYQHVFSPDHGILFWSFGMNRCRFFPTCSEYTLQSLRQYGLLYGTVVSFRRLARCHPWHPGGYDPIRNHPARRDADSRANRISNGAGPFSK